MDEQFCQTPNSSLSELCSAFLSDVATRFEAPLAQQIRQALATAQGAHAGQTRDGGEPFLLHPLRTAAYLVRELGVADADLLCAALLHDVPEDQRQMTPELLGRRFGARIGSIVSTLTKPEARGRSREEINRVYFARLWQASEDCKLIKLADKLDNVRDALTCPDSSKRRRTAAEARDFYLSLAGSLRSRRYREVLRTHLASAIVALESMDGPTASTAPGMQPS